MAEKCGESGERHFYEQFDGVLARLLLSGVVSECQEGYASVIGRSVMHFLVQLAHRYIEDERTLERTTMACEMRCCWKRLMFPRDRARIPVLEESRSCFLAM